MMTVNDVMDKIHRNNIALETLTENGLDYSRCSSLMDDLKDIITEYNEMLGNLKVTK